jgi:hypothetical protein
MEIRNLTRDDVRQTLRASEGIPSQISSARIVGGRVLPATVGHPIASHLYSAGFADNKTKFLSMDDMVEAFWLLLQTPVAAANIANLSVGNRTTIRSEVATVFGFECDVPDPQGRGTVHHVRFTPQEQRGAGRWRTTCVAVVEGRERAGRPHLQIHSFYPAISTAELSALLQAVRKNTERR